MTWPPAAIAANKAPGAPTSSTEHPDHHNELANAVNDIVTRIQDVPGGAGLLLVAASDAPQVVKDRADYVCDGTADEVQINAALAIGSVQLSVGTFNVNSPILVQKWGQTFCGSGIASASSFGSGASITGTRINGTSSFSGSAVVACENPTDGYILGLIHVHSFRVSCSSITGTTTDGILFRAFQSSLHDVHVTDARRDGISLQGNETRTVTDGATTNGSPTLTSASAAFNSRDVGRTISGTGIPASTTITTVNSATSVTMSANATATATGVSVTINNPAWNPYDTRVYSVCVLNSLRDGLSFGLQSADTHVSSSIFAGNDRAGILLGGASHQVTSVHCYGNYHAIYSPGFGSRTKFANCKFEHSDREGVWFDGSLGFNPSQVQFTGCNFANAGKETHNTYSTIRVSSSFAATGLIVSGCTFSTTDGVTNLPKYVIEAGGGTGTNMVVTGNGVSSGAWATAPYDIGTSDTGTFGTSRIVGNVGMGDHLGYPVATAAAGAQAGTSPPSPVTFVSGTSARTRRGSITFGTGTGPSAGSMVVMTFGLAMQEPQPRVMINPRNSATAALGLFVSAFSTTGFTVSCVNAPAASQANTVYGFDYIVGV